MGDGVGVRGQEWEEKKEGEVGLGCKDELIN